MTRFSDFTGSGPFVFKKTSGSPATKAVYVKFDKYKPRADRLGQGRGKVAKVDRMNGGSSPTSRPRSNALIAARSTNIEAAAHDLFPILKKIQLKLADINPLGNHMRSATTRRSSPSTIPRSSRRCCTAFNQEDFLKAPIGDSQHYKACH